MTDARPRFFEGQYLGADDLTAAVEYGRSQASRHLLAAHSWGIALGLDLVEVPGPNGSIRMVVQPGYAWDGFGRPLMVAEATPLPTAIFARFDEDFDPGKPAPEPITVPVWIRYDEALTRDVRPGFESCDDTISYARVVEGVRFEAGSRPLTAQGADVRVGGRDVAAQNVVNDANVPHQTLPAVATRQWLVPLGHVRWKPGSPGSFVERTDAALALSARSRRYCGTIAGTIEANGGHVTIHERGKVYSPHITEELLRVEGPTRVDGDANLYDGALNLIERHGENPVLPFRVARTKQQVPDPGNPGAQVPQTSLRLVIGDAKDGNNRLAVGPQTGADPPTYDDHLVVTDKGDVGIGTSAPAARLHIKGDARVSGDVWTAGLAVVGAADRLRLVAGIVNEAGQGVGGRGFKVKDLTAGRYQLDFVPAFAASPIVVVSRVWGDPAINAQGNVDPRASAIIDQIEPSSAIVATSNVVNGAVKLAPGAFTFLAIGPRVANQ